MNLPQLSRQLQKQTILQTLAVTLVACVATAANAQIIHNEADDGDLSDSGPSPTSFGIFGVGVNTIQGTLGPSAGGTGATNDNDADIFTFDIAPGQFVSSVTTTRSGPGIGSFVGHSPTSSIANFTENDSLGAALSAGGGGVFENDGTIGTVLGDGIPTTLGPGSNTFIFQETGAGPVNYSISFNVASSVPEPTSGMLLAGLGLAGLARRRR